MKVYDMETGSEMADLYQTITYLPQHGYPQRVSKIPSIIYPAWRPSKGK